MGEEEMNGILIFLFLVLVTMPVAEYFSKGKNGRIVYTWPWRWLVRVTNKVSALFDWRVYGDIALTLVVGPILARRWIKYRKVAYLSFFVIFAYLFILPFRGGTALSFSNFIGPAVVLFSGFSGYTLLLIATSAYSIVHAYFTGAHPEPGIAPALPGVSVGGFRIPLVEGVIALFIALLVHETAHGVVAIRERIPVKRGGIITLGLVPIGAYVEPEESVYNKRTLLSRMRVLAAGPVANLFVFLLFGTLLALMTPVGNFLADYECAHGAGVRVLSVPETLTVGEMTIPSASYGILEAGDVVIEVNGVPIRCYRDFFNVLAPINEAEANVVLPLVFVRDGNTMDANITTVNGYIGIRGVDNVYGSPLPFWYHLLSFFISLVSWIALLNFMIGLINTLPLVPLDGGYIYRELFDGGVVYKVFLWMSIVALIVNALPWFV